jgi:2-C-methyl-D-erythritol 4-phosphate cytidylyltransferase/2-C-methyl-D-erythritol 2,4-cyclodiphosphate synthase
VQDLRAGEALATKVGAVVVAAGRGLRAASDVPKQYRPIFGEPIIRASLGAFAHHAGVALVQPVIHAADIALYRSATAGIRTLDPVEGAQTRQGSVHAGLEALRPHAPDHVLVHDAARPFVSAALIGRAIAAACRGVAAIPVIRVADTVKTVDTAGAVRSTLDRDRVRLVQTPQAFQFATLLQAHRRARDAGHIDFPDDAALVEWAGHEVMTFEGEPGNVKLTQNEDFATAEALKLAGVNDVRTGIGFDVHRFVDGDHVMLGGVRVEHAYGLAGHSDADVLLHALVDATLGAIGEGDIGVHFPPTDPQWRGASSDRFLAFAADRVRTRGGLIAHLDATVVCEAPRIGPYRESIRARIAEIAGISVARVGVKATTSEKMGFTGRGEGMAAFATATVRLPWSR